MTYTHADGKREVVVVVKRHSDAEGGGATIFVPSLGREKSTTDDRIRGPIGGGSSGDGGGAGAALALVSPPLNLLLGHADGSMPPLAREQRGRAKGTTYPEAESNGAEVSAPKPTGRWSLSIPGKSITASLDPPSNAEAWAVVSVKKGATSDMKCYDFSAVAANGAAIAACRRWRRDQKDPHKYPGGTTNADGDLVSVDPVFELSLSAPGSGDVYTSCQFSVKPNSCTIQVVHLATKQSVQRQGYGTAALAAMLLGGCHLNQSLFGAATSRMEVTDGTDEVCVNWTAPACAIATQPRQISPLRS